VAAALALVCAVESEPTRPRDAAGLEDEVAQLRQLIRMIGHELGNSLGPIGSLLRSARVILAGQAGPADPGDGEASPSGGRPPAAPAEVLAQARLDLVLRTVAERTTHLQSFLDECVRLTRLPEPRPAGADWGALGDRMRALWPGLAVDLALTGRPALFDVSQIEQVLINLVKNAHEAGGPTDEIRLRVEAIASGGTRVTVLDRGRGATDHEIEAMVRGGFTTKRAGSGMGLAICRELIERHGGRLRVERRAGPGLAVSFWLPDR
jgi:two-component system nitrogen regulation sensor histidine kinase NtrY